MLSHFSLQISRSKTKKTKKKEENNKKGDDDNVDFAAKFSTSQTLVHHHFGRPYR